MIHKYLYRVYVGPESRFVIEIWSVWYLCTYVNYAFSSVFFFKKKKNKWSKITHTFCMLSRVYLRGTNVKRRRHTHYLLQYVCMHTHTAVGVALMCFVHTSRTQRTARRRGVNQWRRTLNRIARLAGRRQKLRCNEPAVSDKLTAGECQFLELLVK